MKTIFKTALAACLALTAGLTSCSKQDEPGPDTNTEKNITVRITQADLGRAAGAHLASGTVTINDAALYFTNGTSVVARWNILSGASAASPQTATSVGISTLEDGSNFINLPATVTNVYFIANKSDGNYAVNDISSLTASGAIALGTQTNVSDVTLFGTSGIGTQQGTNATTGNAQYNVSFEVKPVVARFEIGKLAANGTFASAASTITAFTVQGIYMDNHYKTMGIAGAAGTQQSGGVTAANFVAANYGVASDESGFLAEVEGTRPGYVPFIDVSGTDTKQDVWGYNLLAAAGAPMPTVVIKLGGVVIETDNATKYAGTQFLTIRNIYSKTKTEDHDDNAETPEVPVKLTTLEAGHVYRIDKISFAEGHLTTSPNPTLIDVFVDVRIMDWAAEDVDYNFN